MNIIQIAGRLGQDPETRFTPDGTKVTTLNVAVNIREGSEDVTLWYRVSFWGERYDKMMTHMKKGSAVIIVGNLRKPKVFNRRDGSQDVSLDIRGEMLMFSPFGGRSDGQAQEGFQPQQQQQQQGYTAPQPAPAASGNVAPAQSPGATADDDMPF